MDINQALHKVQQELKAPKGQYNNFGKYHYRSCENILDALKEPLKSVGGIVLLSDEVVLIGERYYIKATATFKLGTDSISVTASAREASDKKGMDDSQITGSTSSYARKYALNGLFAIDDSKDVDTIDNAQQEKKESGKKALTDDRFKDACKSIQQGTYTKEKLIANFKLTAEQLKQVNSL